MDEVIRVRPATAEDIPSIRDLAGKIWPEAYGSILSPEQIRYMMDLLYSESSLERQITQDQHQFLMAVRNDGPLGFASFSPVKGGGYKLHKLYVLPSFQGSGIGKKLLSRVIQEGRAAGAPFLDLNVNRFNPARKFYERLGFRILQEVDIPIGNGYFMNDFVMRLPLPSGA